MRWTVYTRVVDNFGDIGFSWRLAAALAARGERVRLAVDDASALDWMVPDGTNGVTVVPWRDAGHHGGAPPDVLVETVGAGLPDAALAAVANSSRPPVHIDVEHLSAEPYTLRSHGLRTPHHLADGRPFPTWFFFPGFVAGSGGLLRERGLAEARAAFDRTGWLASHGLALRDGERCVSLFGYAQPALAPLLDALAAAPTLLLLSPGATQRDAHALLGPRLARGALRAITLPWLDQRAYDGLLWCCDLALVRGEDSLVRAIWSGNPFLWQLYPQDDGAHAAKLAAFLDVYLDGAEPALEADLRSLFLAWNGLASATVWPTARLAPGAAFDAWRRHATERRDPLAAHPDLVSQLVGFAASRR